MSDRGDLAYPPDFPGSGRPIAPASCRCKVLGWLVNSPVIHVKFILLRLRADSLLSV